MPVEAEVVAARLTRIKILIDAVERTCLERGCLDIDATRETFQKLKHELEAARISVRPPGPARREMAQLSNERRSRLFSEPPPACRECESQRVTCVGLAGHVGFFRCSDCNGVFSIDLTASADEAAHDADKET